MAIRSGSGRVTSLLAVMRDMKAERGWRGSRARLESRLLRDLHWGRRAILGVMTGMLEHGPDQVSNGAERLLLILLTSLSNQRGERTYGVSTTCTTLPSISSSLPSTLRPSRSMTSGMRRSWLY